MTSNREANQEATMLQHPTLEKLQELRLDAMARALQDQIYNRKSVNSISWSVSDCWWTGKPPNERADD
jgi:hypothetical protein